MNYYFYLNIYLKNFVIICLCFVIDSKKNLRYIVESTIKPLLQKAILLFVYKKLESMKKKGYNRHATWIIPQI